MIKFNIQTWNLIKWELNFSTVVKKQNVISSPCNLVVLFEAYLNSFANTYQCCNEESDKQEEAAQQLIGS